MASRQKLQPLFANEKHMAELLDMDRQTFRRLWTDGILPGPVIVGGLERWDVEAMQKALRGEALNEPEPTW